MYLLSLKPDTDQRNLCEVFDYTNDNEVKTQLFGGWFIIDIAVMLSKFSSKCSQSKGNLNEEMVR